MFLGPGWSLSRSLECSLIAGDFMEGGDSAQAVCVSTRLVVPVTVLQQRIQFRSVNEKVRNTVIRHYLTGNRRKLVTVTPTGGFVLRWPPSHREARTVAIILWFYCSFPGSSLTDSVSTTVGCEGKANNESGQVAYLSNPGTAAYMTSRRFIES